MAEDRKNGNLKGIEPDSKSQVTMLYENEKPVKVTSVVISTQHSRDLNQEQVREAVLPYIHKSIPESLLTELDQKEIYINPTGQFIIGGPDGDTGLTGEKLLWTLMVGRRRMVVVHFQEKIQQKWTDQPLCIKIFSKKYSCCRGI